ncbi:polysaccharide biosynthesis protein [Flavobacterium fragile]
MINKKMFPFGYTPRWVIFFIDVVLLIAANVLTYSLLKSLTSNFYDVLSPMERYSIVVVVNIFCFYIYKTYSGIIRHSSMLDAIKLVLSTGTSFLIITILNITSLFVVGEKIFLFPGLILNAILTFTFLFLFRITTKYVFETLMDNIQTKDLIPTVILGTDANAIAIANSLQAESPARFKMVGFMEIAQPLNRFGVTKRILGLPILYTTKKPCTILKVLNVKAIIIADKNLAHEKKIEIIDDCLQNNIKVYRVQLISDWGNKSEISKKIQSFEIEDLLNRKPILLDNKLISNKITNNTILITGAAGSIGSEIVRQVANYHPNKIILIDQAETPLHSLRLELEKNGETNVVSIVADIRNKKVMDTIFANYQPEFVFHAAAYKHVPLMEENPSQAIETNVIGTKNVADTALKYGVKNFVMISTDKAVNPSNVMGASKRIAEIYIQNLHQKSQDQQKTKFIITRFGNVLGSNGSVVPLFKQQIENGGPVTLTHAEIIRYFMTISEACQLVLEAGAIGNGGEIYIFDMGEPVKIIDLAKKMIQLGGYVPYKDIDIKEIGLRPGEKLYEELLNDKSKTLPTHHEKIMVATECDYDFSHTDTLIKEVMKKAKNNENNMEIVSLMKQIVPEFKSLNSNYEVLDN